MRIHVIAVLAVGCGGGGTTTDAPPGTDARAGADAAQIDGAPPIDAATCPSTTAIDPAATPELAIGGDAGSTLGIFDPSIVYPAGAPGGAMSYSSVPDQHSIRTRIALSPDAGASWTYVGEANQPVATVVAEDGTGSGPLECGGTCTGFLISEVSSLVFDPDDPDPARRWKLFAHRYLAEADNTLHYRYGTIALQTAPEPQGPWTAPAPLIGWDSKASISSAGVAHNITADPAIADCAALTEPGAMWRPRGAGSALELAVGCPYFPPSGAPRIRIVLLRSTDHAATWSYVGELLSGNDAACLDADPSSGMNAANLFLVGTTEYLAATPGHSDGIYRGCMVVPVDDPEAGTVRRDDGGRPRWDRALVASTGQFAGACTYAEGATAMGYAMPIGFLGTGRPFRIFTTGVAAP